jgi:hypothetical protein
LTSVTNSILDHPPSQDTPHLCGEECYCYPLRRDVALHARRMTTPSCLVIAQRAKTEAFGEGGSCNGDHGFTRWAPFIPLEYSRISGGGHP